MFALYILQAYLVYKYRGKNNEVQHTTMMSKGSRHTTYGPKSQNAPSDTLTSNANSTFDKYGEKPNDLGESESLLEKDIQVRLIGFFNVSRLVFHNIYMCLESLLVHSPARYFINKIGAP